MKGNQVNNEFGETWIELGPGDEVYDKVVECIDYKKEFDPGIIYVAETPDRDGKHYITQIHGGLNGNGHSDWVNYLDQIKNILVKFKTGYAKDVWIIDIVNDCLDDVWDCRFGFEI